MNTCQAFQHPEARMMCYAVKSGQLGDQKDSTELEAMQVQASPQPPTDKVEMGRSNPEADEYYAASAQLLAMARSTGKS